VNQLLDSDTVFVDARFERDFRASHIAQAIGVTQLGSFREESQQKIVCYNFLSGIELHNAQ